MFRIFRVLLLAPLLLSASIVVTINAAAATTSVPATSLGVDVSFPQCGATLPTPIGFGVVGVNDGRPMTANPCLASELAWSATTLSATPAFYANTGDPGPLNNPSWPTSQQTPEVCTGADSVACSYDWGWTVAQNSFQDAVAAETQLGASSPTTAAAAAPWWLDVETANSWESLGTGAPATSAQLANDLSTIQGEVASFTSVGVSTVGIYSTSYQWSTIVGSSATSLAANNVWLPGYATLSDAQAACTANSFTGGRVAMIQYPSNGLDGDYVCPLESVPASASVSVASSASFTDQLGVSGVALPVTYVQTSGAPSLTVSSSGVVTTSGQLASGTYSASGTTSTNGLVGTFSFSLLVGLLVQTTSNSASSTVSASSTFTEQLALSGANGPLTFTQTSGTPALVVSPTGLLSTSGTLTRGTYVAQGTASDQGGDSGAFDFHLVVGTISRLPPTKATVGPRASATFTDQLAVSGANGPVTFTQTSGTPSLVISTTGLVSTSGALAIGSYVARGTTGDPNGDKGTFLFNLIVSGVGALVQDSPASSIVSPSSSATFTNQLALSGASGLVTFTQTSGTPSLAVSTTGLVSTSGALAIGSYLAQGTTADGAGDTGVFAFIVQVAAVRAPIVTRVLVRRVVGTAVAGRTVLLRIFGSGFYGRPTITAHAGTTVQVLNDTGTQLVLRVRVRSGSRPGTYLLMMTFAGRPRVSVHYVQH